ncbi:hypothetical protein GCM10023085_02540 [Actinomadura viridis]
MCQAPDGVIQMRSPGQIWVSFQPRVCLVETLPGERLHAITVCAAGLIVFLLLMALIRVVYNAGRGTVRADGSG